MYINDNCLALLAMMCCKCGSLQEGFKCWGEWCCRNCCWPGGLYDRGPSGLHSEFKGALGPHAGLKKPHSGFDKFKWLNGFYGFDEFKSPPFSPKGSVCKGCGCDLSGFNTCKRCGGCLCNFKW